MRCKNHPHREAEHYCMGCGIPICDDCTEEGKPGEYVCFQCAMLSSVSKVGGTIKDRHEKLAEKKEKAQEKKWTPFRYFLMVSSVLIVVMWGVILFGGQKAPGGGTDYLGQPRVLLFLVDSAIKRYAHYEGNQYPAGLSDMIPKYLKMRDEDLPFLEALSYERDPKTGYRLSLAKPKPGDMNIVMTPKGIEQRNPAGEVPR
jgi:hypothetical protein